MPVLFTYVREFTFVGRYLRRLTSSNSKAAGKSCDWMRWISPFVVEASAAVAVRYYDAADRRSLCSMMNTPVRTERRKAVGRFATVKVTDSFEHALIQTDACRQWMDGIDCYCYFFSVILHLVFHWIYLLESKDVRTWENCHCNVKRLCSTMYSGTIFLDSQKRVVRDTVPEI